MKIAINNTNNTVSQHFYLRLKTKEEKKKGAPVGVILVQKEHGNDTVKIAGSMVSKKDSFAKKTGRAIAAGRLEKGEYIPSTTDNINQYGAFSTAHDLGLCTVKGNHFLDVDWQKAERDLKSTLDFVEERLALRVA